MLKEANKKKIKWREPFTQFALIGAALHIEAVRQ